MAFTTHDPYGKNRFLVVVTNLGQSLTDHQYLTVMTHFLVVVFTTHDPYRKNRFL